MAAASFAGVQQRPAASTVNLVAGDVKASRTGDQEGLGGPGGRIRHPVQDAVRAAQPGVDLQTPYITS